MRKTRYVEFTPEGARVHVNKRPETDNPVVVNPDLSRVRGVPPHEWRLVGSIIIAKSAVRPTILVQLLHNRWVMLMLGAVLGTLLGHLIS